MREWRTTGERSKLYEGLLRLKEQHVYPDYRHRQARGSNLSAGLGCGNGLQPMSIGLDLGLLQPTNMRAHTSRRRV